MPISPITDERVSTSGIHLLDKKKQAYRPSPLRRDDVVGTFIYDAEVILAPTQNLRDHL